MATNHRGILCSLCNEWTHAKCNKLDNYDFSKYKEDESLTFFCSPCLEDSVPFQGLSDNEFTLTMNGIVLPNDEVDVDNISLTDKQIELTKKINAALARGFNNDEEDESDIDIDMIDCK